MSAVEIAIKMAIGKLDLKRTAAVALEEAVSALGAAELPFTIADAVLLQTLPWHHRDPFDRMLIVQAQRKSLTLVTADQQLTAYDVQCL